MINAFKKILLLANIKQTLAVQETCTINQSASDFSSQSSVQNAPSRNTQNEEIEIPECRDIKNISKDNNCAGDNVSEEYGILIENTNSNKDKTKTAAQSEQYQKSPVKELHTIYENTEDDINQAEIKAQKQHVSAKRRLAIEDSYLSESTDSYNLNECSQQRSQWFNIIICPQEIYQSEITAKIDTIKYYHNKNTTETPKKKTHKFLSDRIFYILYIIAITIIIFGLMIRQIILTI